MVYQRIGQRKYPAEQEESSRGVKSGRTAHCNSLQSNDTEIDWSAEDLHHLKVKQLKVFSQEHCLKSGNKSDLIKGIQEYQKSVLSSVPTTGVIADMFCYQFSLYNNVNICYK